VYVVCSLVRIHRFKIDHVPHNRKLIRNSVITMHITGMTCNLQRLSAVTALDQGPLMGRTRPLSKGRKTALR
jgi:hypothetical protein